MTKFWQHVAAGWVGLSVSLAPVVHAQDSCSGGVCTSEHFRLELPAFGGAAIQGASGPGLGNHAGGLQLGAHLTVVNHAYNSRTFFRIRVAIAGNAVGFGQGGYSGGVDTSADGMLGVVIGPYTSTAQFAVLGTVDASGTYNQGPGAALSEYRLFASGGVGARFQNRRGLYVLVAPMVSVGRYAVESNGQTLTADGAWLGGLVDVAHHRVAGRVLMRRLLGNAYSSVPLAGANASVSQIQMEITIPILSNGRVSCQGGRGPVPTPDFTNMTLSLGARGDLGIVETPAGVQLPVAVSAFVNVHWLEMLVRNTRPILCR